MSGHTLFQANSKLKFSVIFHNFLSRLVNELGMQDLQVCYGTTETSPVSFMSVRDDPPEERIRNVGHIMDHLEVRGDGDDQLCSDQ